MFNKAIIAIFFILALFLFSFVKPIFAVTVTIPNFPSTITEDSFTIMASISGAAAGTNYLRIDLFKDGSENYFGETFNGTDWYGGSTYSQYLPITIQSGTVWSGNVQGRVGSPTSTQYDNSGTYKMRLRRYTGGGGNTATEADNSAVTVTIVLPTPTPTLSPTPTNSPTSAPTSVPTSSPTNAPTPMPTSVPTKTSTIAPTNIPMPTSGGNLSTSVLGETTQEGGYSLPMDINSLNSTPVPDKSVSTKSNQFQKISIFIGVVFLIACAILMFRVIKKGGLTQNEEE